MSAIVLDDPGAVLAPLTLDLPGLGRMDDAEFLAFCQSRPDLRIEMDENGNLIVMPPVLPDSGNKELRLGAQLQTWADRDGGGVAFSSSTMVTLPNGAKRSPDASWTTREAMEALLETGEGEAADRHCPFFVLELRSGTDRLAPLLHKMREWIRNGARLGILVDPLDQRAGIFRPEREPEWLERPDRVPAEPEMPGLVFDLAKIW